MEKSKTRKLSDFIQKLTKAAKKQPQSEKSILEKYSDRATEKVDEGISKLIQKTIITE